MAIPPHKITRSDFRLRCQNFYVFQAMIVKGREIGTDVPMHMEILCGWSCCQLFRIQRKEQKKEKNKCKKNKTKDTNSINNINKTNEITT